MDILENILDNLALISSPRRVLFVCILICLHMFSSTSPTLMLIFLVASPWLLRRFYFLYDSLVLRIGACIFSGFAVLCAVIGGLGGQPLVRGFFDATTGSFYLLATSILVGAIYKKIFIPPIILDVQESEDMADAT